MVSAIRRAGTREPDGCLIGVICSENGERPCCNVCSAGLRTLLQHLHQALHDARFAQGHKVPLIARQIADDCHSPLHDILQAPQAKFHGCLIQQDFILLHASQDVRDEANPASDNIPTQRRAWYREGDYTRSASGLMCFMRVDRLEGILKIASLFASLPVVRIRRQSMDLLTSCLSSCGRHQPS